MSKHGWTSGPIHVRSVIFLPFDQFGLSSFVLTGSVIVLPFDRFGLSSFVLTGSVIVLPFDRFCLSLFCPYLYPSISVPASSSPSVVFRSNPAGCLTLSLVVVRLLRPLRAIFDRSGRFRRCPAPSGTVRPLVVWLPLPCVVCPRPSQYDPFQSSV